MPAAKRKARTRRDETTPDAIACSIVVQRGGVSVQVEGIVLEQAGEVAAYVLTLLGAQRGAHPELSPPQEVVQLGGYTPVEVHEDEGAMRKRIGFPLA